MKKKLRWMIVLIIVITILVWMIWGNITVGVTRYSVENERLPAVFDHYKIAVVSDLHNAELGEDNKRLVSAIEKEKPDMIAITGDLVDSGRTDIGVAENLIRQLAMTAPCYYVTGNHEAWIGEQYQKLEKILLNEGVVILHDQSVSMTKNDETIQIVGLDDPDFTDRDSSIQESMLERKLEEMELTGEFCILLSHRPEVFNAYVAENIDLVLCGHAHGGQFRILGVGGLVAPNQGLLPKYDAGEYSENNTTMIVSRGIGNSVIPVRINNRPEIVVVELRCK